MNVPSGSLTGVGGALNLNGASATLGGNLDLSGGLTASAGASFDLTVGGNLQLASSASLGFGGDVLDVNGNLTINSGGLNLTTAGADLDLAGNLSLSGTGALAAATGTTLGVGGSLDLGSGTGVTLTGNADLTIGSNLAIGTGATLAAGTGTDLSLGGNWINNGSFTPSTSTVTLAGGNQTLNGSTTFYNLAKSDAANNSTLLQLKLASGSTQTVTGTLTLDGLDNNDWLAISSTVAGSPATITFSGGSAASAIGNFLIVTDNSLSNAAGASISFPINPASSVNGGNTTNWFTGGPTDTDGDSIYDSVELLAPNGGDANGDGTPDFSQNNVASSINPATNAYTTVEATGGTIVSSAILREADLAVQSPTIDFPVGLNTFTLAVQSSGATASVRVIYDKVYDTSGWKFYSAFPNGTFAEYGAPVTFQTSLIGGSNVTVTSFSLTDGGVGDYDNTADGLIHDPHGPGVLVGGILAPFTGLLAKNMYLHVAALVGGIGLLVYLNRKRLLALTNGKK